MDACRIKTRLSSGNSDSPDLSQQVLTLCIQIDEDAFCILVVAEVNAIAIAEHLVIILREGNDESKVVAFDIFQDLSGYEHSILVIRNSSAIPFLVELLRDENGEVREKVSGAIAQLSYNKANRVALADAGAIPILIESLLNELRGGAT